MALSVIVYPGDGVRTQFNIPFALGYIKESDVTARVDGEVDGAGNQVYRTLVFLSPEIVEVQGPAVPVGTNIIFERTVVQDELIVDYEDGDVINEDNMNTSQKQMIMLVHQVLDGRFAQFQSGFDMGGFVITGLGAPTNPGDAANKGYVDGLISDGAANVVAAVAARDAAIAARNAAQASQAAAATSAGQAATSATNSANSATASQSSANASSTSAAASQASRVASDNSAASAATSAANAQSSAQAAQDSNVSAYNWQVGAQGYAGQAASSASAASTSATNAANSASNAETNKNISEAAAIRAYNWAMANENAPVDDGVRTGYSAYHWAAKAAASAAAAATFDPSAYVAKSGDTMLGNLNVQNPASSGRSVVGFKNSTGATTWMLTGGLDGTDQSFRILNSAGAGIVALNLDGTIFTTNYGWLHDRFAQKNTYCRHYDGGVLESGSVNPGGGNQTHDIPSPYVMTGLRTIGGNNQTFLRSKAIFNTGG